MKLTYSLSELCTALGYSERRFAEVRPRLEAAGFPPPVPGMGLRWSMAAVTEYVNQQCSGASSLPAEATGRCDAAPASAAPVVLQRMIQQKYGARP